MRDSIGRLVQVTRDLDQSINGDIQQISTAADMTYQVSEETQQSANAVGDAVVGINSTAAEMETVAQVIEELKTKVSDILSMVDIIRTVAEQTNLLALNAAIEAARAGEQGRGFSVVADEVRALAQRTQDSTEDIARVVDELIACSNRAFSAIEESNAKAGGAVELVDGINRVLSQVAGQMGDLNSSTKSISSSAYQQLKDVAEVNENMSKIDLTANEHVGGVETVAVVSQQLSSSAESMLSKIKRYKVS